VPLVLLLPFWLLTWLAAQRALASRRLPGDRFLAYQRWRRALFWVALLVAVVGPNPAAALDSWVGPVDFALLLPVAVALWAVPGWWVERRLRGIPASLPQYLVYQEALHALTLGPYAVWLLLTAVLLATGLGRLLVDPWTAVSLVAAYMALFLVGLPHALASLFPRTDAALNRRTAALAARAGVPFRRVAILPTRPVRLANAFVVGAGGGYVFVTDHLLDLLDADEVDAVVAHELSHVRLRHTWRLALVGLVLPLVATLFPAAGLFAVVGVFALLYALMRRFEFQADRNGARLVGSGQALARALRRLRDAAGLPSRRPHRQSGLLSSHPPTDERIRRLERLA
jgi:heat shock protein HtpX